MRAFLFPIIFHQYFMILQPRLSSKDFFHFDLSINSILFAKASSKLVNNQALIFGKMKCFPLAAHLIILKIILAVSCLIMAAECIFGSQRKIIDGCCASKCNSFLFPFRRNLLLYTHLSGIF